ncbi:MAG TPA: hypothetical protein VMW70_10165 [Burkholderiales bacterium]|nr:hypothetical protein [Burkholderiales bacterium]
MVNVRPETTTSCIAARHCVTSGRFRLYAAGGVFALATLPCHGLEIGRATVDSAQGEPLDALVRIVLDPAERLDSSCLSAGTQSDFPESDHILLTNGVRMRLEPDRKAIRITTARPVTEPEISVAVRARCLRGPVTVRAFNLRLMPARPNVVHAAVTSKRMDRPTDGTTIIVKPGDSIYGLARTIYPRNEKAVGALVSAIVRANPLLFPDGLARPLQIGERLKIPDLRRVPGIVSESDTQSVSPRARPAKSVRHVPDEKPSGITTHTPATHEGTLRLKLARSLDLGRSRGVDENQRDLLRARVNQAEPPASGGVSGQNEPLSSRLDRVTVSQKQIDARLASLEAKAIALGTITISAAKQRPSGVATPAASPNRPAADAPQPGASIEPGKRPWWQWAVFAIGLSLLGVAAFFLGRHWRRCRTMKHRQTRIEEMLEQARSDAAPLLGRSTEQQVKSEPSERTFGRDEETNESVRDHAADYAPGLPTQRRVMKEPSLQLPAAEQNMPPTVKPTTPPESFDASGEISTKLHQEMNDSLDSTRSMFSDIDRFIALGRIQNAINMLEFQIKREPDDRASWIKLMAVYRHNTMDNDFDRVYANYRERFENN